MLAVVCLLVAFLRRHSGADLFAAVAHADTRDSRFDAFTPIRIGHSYLWMGVGAGLLVVVAGSLLARPFSTAATRALALSAVAVAASCLVVAQLQRDDLDAAAAGIEGAYFNHATDSEPPLVTEGNALDPFSVGNAYLWVGIAIGLLTGICSAVAAGTGRYRRLRP